MYLQWEKNLEELAYLKQTKLSQFVFILFLWGRSGVMLTGSMLARSLVCSSSATKCMPQPLQIFIHMDADKIRSPVNFHPNQDCTVNKKLDIEVPVFYTYTHMMTFTHTHT